MVFFLALVLATEGFLVASLVARQSTGSFLASVIASQVMSLTNDARAAQKDVPLTDNKQLDAAAQAKANDMAAKGYFSHQSPDGKTPWDFISASGYNYQYAGENLAVRFIDSKDVVNAWMASPTHRANIMKPVYRETGIGIAQGLYKGSSATFVVQYFCTPSGAVLGAEVGPPQMPSWFNSLVRQGARLFSDPRGSTAWIFGGIAGFLMLLLALAFFFHIQVQSAEILLPGVVVAGIAVFFLTFNGAFLSVSNGGQAASSIQAGIPDTSTIIIDDSAASTP